MAFTKTTEQDSHYDHLEKMSVEKILTTINKEDSGVAEAVKIAVPQIEVFDKGSKLPEIHINFLSIIAIVRFFYSIVRSYSILSSEVNIRKIKNQSPS